MCICGHTANTVCSAGCVGRLKHIVYLACGFQGAALRYLFVYMVPVTLNVYTLIRLRNCTIHCQFLMLMRGHCGVPELSITLL